MTQPMNACVCGRSLPVGQRLCTVMDLGLREGNGVMLGCRDSFNSWCLANGKTCTDAQEPVLIDQWLVETNGKRKVIVMLDVKEGSMYDSLTIPIATGPVTSASSLLIPVKQMSNEPPARGRNPFIAPDAHRVQRRRR